MQQFAKRLNLRKLLPQLLLPGIITAIEDEQCTLDDVMTGEGRRLRDNQLKPQCDALSNEILVVIFCD